MAPPIHMGDDRRTSVLVIDDERVIVEALRRILGAEGFEVYVEEDAESALRGFEESRPDIVVVDLKLPGMSGIEFLERIRPTAEEVAFVLMSGFAGSELVVSCLQAGAFGYLPKPFTFEEARSVVSRAAKFRRMTAEERRPQPGSAVMSGMLGVQSWVRLREDGTAVVGVTDVFVRTAGSIRSVILPLSDFPLMQGDALVRVTDDHGYPFVAWSAMGGQVIAINLDLENDPSALTRDPFGAGWIARLQPVDAAGDLANLESGL